METTKIKPIRNNVLIKAYEWPSISDGGIILPEILKYSNTRGGKDPWKGRVISIGEKVKQVNVGDIVRYQPNNYYAFTIYDGQDRYIVLDELLIYAIENENENLIKALKNRVVFLPDKAIENKWGSFYLPQTYEKNILNGTVTMAGENTDLEAGDKVVIENKNLWQYFNIKGQRYILTDKVNILCKIDG